MSTNEFFRRPWVGPQYRSGANLIGSRLLVVGESHYHRCDSNCADKNHEELTINTVQAIVSGRWRHSFFTKIAELFKHGEDNLAHFWNSVSYYNYLQQLFATPRLAVDRATRLDPANQTLFFRILQELEPQRVLVLGKANWGALPSKLVKDGPIICRESSFLLQLPGQLNADDKSAYWYPIGKRGWTLVGAVQHPSSYGFSASKLQSWVEAFLEFQGDIIVNVRE